MGAFSSTELALAKKLSYENMEKEDTDLGFEYKGQWITNPFLECSARFEFKNLDAMFDYYGKDNICNFIKQILNNNESNNVVLDRVTKENTSEYCDFVICNNCGKLMLINYGEDICPECSCEGTLSFAEKSREEILYRNANIELEEMNYELSDAK